MVNWYSKYKEYGPTYVDFAHPEEHSSRTEELSFGEKYGDVYLWYYENNMRIKIVPLGDLDGHHELDNEIGDSPIYDISGRYSSKLNMASVAGYGSPYKYVDAILQLEKKFGSNLKIFMSTSVMGNQIKGTFTVDSIIKILSNLKVMHAQGKNKKQAETVKIRDMYTLKPTSVYVARNPSWDELMSMIDRSYYGSLRLLKDKNGDVLAWDSKDGIHYQIASALGLNTNAYRADGPEIRIDEKWKLKLHNPPGPYSFNNFYDKKLKSIGSNEYLVVEDEMKKASIIKESQVTLNQIYFEDGFDEEELLYHYIYNNDIPLDASFAIKTASPQELLSFMTPMGDITVFESFKNFATKEQKQIVKNKINRFDNERIIVLDGNVVLDGNHQLVAAIISGKPQKYIDISDYEETEDELV